MVVMNQHRICVLSERLARPFDEGFKNLSLSLIREFSREHKVLGLTTLGEDLPELGVRRVRASKSLLSIALWRCISAFRPRTIYYVPTASYTLFSFMRARVLASYGRGADVEMIALQPRNLGRLSRAIIPRFCPDFLWVQSPQSMGMLDELGCPAGLLPQEEIDNFDKHDYSGKGKGHSIVMNHHHVSSAAGLCMFAWIMCKHDVLNDSLTHTTGHTFTDADIQQVGARIAALRTAFNIREGVRSIDFDTPGRSIGQPPLEDGPLAGITVDLEAQVTDFCNAMGWDPRTGIPTKETLKGLGLEKIAADLHT